MSGIRLYHPTARSGYFTVEQRGRPYRRWNPVLKKHEATPLLCVMCQKSHAVKTYHIQVDSEGFAFVSTEIWDFMKQNNTAGFELANEVTNPPDQILSMAGQPIPQTLAALNGGKNKRR